MITLRPLQEKGLDDIRPAFRRVRRVCYRAPTGFGKTQLGARTIQLAAAKGLECWIVLHRDYLVEQTSLTFDQHGIEYSFIAAGRYHDPSSRVFVCSIDTLRHRLHKLRQPDFIIVDEAHHAVSKSWASVLNWATKAKILGLTATPQRLDGKGLIEQFDELVQGPSTSQLIEQGWLSKYHAYAPTRPRLDGIHTVAGDYNLGQLDALMNDNEIVGNLPGHYRKFANGRRALYFAVSISHSKKIAATFNAAGIRAAHIDGTSSTEDRVNAARALARGDISVISNIALCGEGFDLAAIAGEDCTIEAVGLARPTKSLTLYLQAVGRALRPKPNPAIILDHAGCIFEHGLPDDEREWSLAGVARRKKPGDSLAVTQCGHCFGVYRSTLTACPYCGTVREIARGREVEEVAGELAEVVARPRVVDLDRAKAKGYDALVELARRRGYRNPSRWAMYVHEAREKKAAERASQGRWV